jgi:16S rRNA G966 N2-methylase RsmD
MTMMVRTTRTAVAKTQWLDVFTGRGFSGTTAFSALSRLVSIVTAGLLQLERHTRTASHSNDLQNSDRQGAAVRVL